MQRGRQRPFDYKQSSNFPPLLENDAACHAALLVVNDNDNKAL